MLSTLPQWLGVPASFVAFGFALYVFVVAPGTLASRMLVAMLITDGIAVISSYQNSYTVNALLGTDFLPWGRIHQASDYALVFIYLPFLGLTLNSPLVAPLKGKNARTLLLLTGAISAFAMFVLPETILRFLQAGFYVVICVVLAWGFVAAMHSWYVATSEAVRARARAFTMAFGLRDVCWTATFAVTAAVEFEVLQATDAIKAVTPSVYAGVLILYVPLVAYGMLRTQLFDVDLRIKRTLKRSTVAASFLAAFFLVSELAATYLSDLFGTLLGIAGASGLVFFLAPIQRMAERVSDAAMPGTQATPEYEAYRKLQVYEAAVQAAVEEGGISAHHRRILDSLVQSLGIDLGAAAQLERDAVA
jgi:hypothetical protein